MASSRSEGRHHHDAALRRIAWCLVGAALAVVGYCAILPAPSGSDHQTAGGPPIGVFFVVVAAALAVATFGLRHNRPEPRLPWKLLLCSAIFVPLGEFARQVSVWFDADSVGTGPSLGTWNGYHAFAGQNAQSFTLSVLGSKLTFAVPSPVLHAVDAATWLLPALGGCFALLGLTRLLRSRQRALDRHLYFESAVVIAVTGVISWSLLVQPAMDRSNLLAPFLAAFPVIDIAALYVVLLWKLTIRRRSPAFGFLGASIALHLISDVMIFLASNSANQVGGDASSLADNIWYRAALGALLVSTALFAAALLHPSVHQLGTPQPEDAVPHESLRYQLLVGLGLCGFAIQTTLRPLATEAGRLLVGGASILLVVVVLQRAWRSTTAQVEADRHVRDLNDALRASIGRLENAETDERRRIARELHDTVVQDLAALRWQFAELGARAANENVSAELDELSDHLVEITKTARGVSHRLESPVVDAASLDRALRAEVLALRSHELSIDLQCDFEGNLPAPTAALAFRTAREALRNVVRHADARHATVTVNTRGGILQGEIRDDGIGIDPDALEAQLRAGHIGVVSMRDSVTVAGGTFAITGNHDGGTTIRFALPCTEPERPQTGSAPRVGDAAHRA